MSGSKELETYRLVFHFAGNSKTTVWVRASNRHEARSRARQEYSRKKASLRSCLPRTPPDDAEVLEA